MSLVGASEGVLNFEENGGPLWANSPAGTAWFVFPDMEPLAFPDSTGRVLLAQLVTSGQVSWVLNLNTNRKGDFHPGNGFVLGVPRRRPGMHFGRGLQHSEQAQFEDGYEFPSRGTIVLDIFCSMKMERTCDEFEIEGARFVVMQFDPQATDDNGSCLFMDLCGYVGRK